MRALRVVGLTEDGEVVLEDPVRLERFRVSADERLRAAARGDLSRLGQIAIELESQLRPREIQARIRAGASVEQVAAAAGVPEQKIERFAYPVLLERFRTAENAQRAHPVRPEGPDNRTLAEVVGHTFGLRGQAYEGARWDSWKGEDGRWVVALDWRAGRSHNRAHWTFQPGAHGGTVTALDEHASDLVEGLPARPLRTVGAVVDMTRPEEEPSPAPSPVEQWRAAASDSYRERMPHTPEPARPAGDRGATRTAPEPWRPAPPVPRQAEPAEARLVEQRTGSHRGAEGRPERDTGHRTADRAPSQRGGTAEPGDSVVPEQAGPGQTHAEQTHTEQMQAGPARSEVAQTAPASTGPVAPRPVDTGPVDTGPVDTGPGGTGHTHTDPAPWDRGRIAENPSPSTAPADPPAARVEPVAVEPVAVEPDAVEPDAVEPDAVEPVAVEPDAVEPDDAAGGDGAPGPERAAVAATDTSEPVTDTSEPVTDTSGPAESAEPSAVESAPTEPEEAAAPDVSAQEPAAHEPAAHEPAAHEPAAQAPAQEPAAQGLTPAPAEVPPTAETPAAGRRTRKGKPVMPSWDEVLLGVRGPR